MQALLNGLRWLFTATLPAGRLLGIPLRVHVLMLLFLPMFAWALLKPNQGSLFNLLSAVIYVGVLYGSVLAHEFGHAWGCRLVGGYTEYIVLTPIGGLHMGTGGMESPRSELIVVGLGPAVSVLLALVGWVSWWALNAAFPIETLSAWAWLGVVAVKAVAGINMMLAAFNLLFPLFPMDSARLLRAVLSLRRNPETVTAGICKVGIGLAIVVLFAGLLRFELPLIGSVGPLLCLIAIMGIQSCLHEQERAKHMDVYSRSDDWGRGPVYYDQDLVRGAKAKAREDIGGLFRFKRRPSSKKSRVPGPAKVIDISPQRDPDRIEDPAELRTMMRAAAASEDFKLAARLKRRLREIEKRENA